MAKSKSSHLLLPKHRDRMAVAGENMKLARLRRRLTTAMVAERAGISRGTLHQIEEGSPSVSIGAYYNVLRVYGLESDLAGIATDDVLGRKLQDLELLNKKKG